VLIGVVVTLAALAVAIAVGLVRRVRGGRLRAVDDPHAGHAGRLAALGFTPGTAATLLQFSSQFCAPCRATARVCAEMAGQLPGVRHVEVDAADHLDVARALNIWRTPTVLVLDDAGRIVRRAVGSVAPAELRDALAPLLPAATRGRPPLRLRDRRCPPLRLRDR
jgi:thiol-disulfide isomerase/thioredoxin